MKNPKDIFVLTPTPIPGTFGRAELEQAAAMLIRTLQVLDRPWGPVMPQDLGQALNVDLLMKHPWRHPFFNPDFDGLIENGFAQWVEREGCEGRGRPMEFTPKGLARLQR